MIILQDLIKFSMMLIVVSTLHELPDESAEGKGIIHLKIQMSIENSLLFCPLEFFHSMKSSKSRRNVNKKNIKSHVVGKVSVPLQSVVDHQSPLKKTWIVFLLIMQVKAKRRESVKKCRSRLLCMCTVSVTLLRKYAL